MSELDLILPETLAHRYKPERLLGSGGFGKVYLVRDQQLDRPVALKILDRSLDSDTDRRRFDREARVTSRIGHPNIVEVYDHGVLPDGAPFIAYEFVKGPDLTSMLDPSRPPEFSEIQALAGTVARALGAAHEAGVVHRDIKPENVLLRGPTDPVLCDFGVARLDETGTVFTQDGLMLGTPAYMAPELWEGGVPSPASDQFAWAATLLELLGGGTYYGTNEVEEILRSLDSGLTSIAHECLRKLPSGFSSALRRALEPRPENRYPDMEAFARALEITEEAGPARHAETVQLDPEVSGVRSRPGVATQPIHRSRVRPMVPVALAALLGVGLIALRTRHGPPADPTPEPARAPEPELTRAAHVSLLDETERLMRYLKVDFPVYRIDNDRDRLMKIYPAYSNHIFEPKWRRFLDKLVGALVAAHEDSQEGADPPPLPGEPVRVAEQVLLDLNAFDFRLSNLGLGVLRNLADMRDDPKTIDWDPSWDKERMGALREAVLGELEAGFKAMKSLDLERDDDAIEVIAYLAYPSNLRAGLEVLPQVHRRLLRSRDDDSLTRWSGVESRILERCRDRTLFSYPERLALLRQSRDHILREDLPVGLPARSAALTLVCRELYRTPFFFEMTQNPALHADLKATLRETLERLLPIAEHAPEAIEESLGDRRRFYTMHLAFPRDFHAGSDVVAEKILEKVRTAR